MRQDKKQKDKPAIALALCFCLMALVSVFAVKSNIDKVNENMGVAETSEVVQKKAVDDAENDSEGAAEKEGATEKEDASEKTEAGTEIVDSRDSQPQETPSGDNAGNVTDNDATPASEYMMPVEGEIIVEYSMDMPIYWKTLDQYMTHSGIDIASAVGTPVQACAAGTVTKIEENDKMGVTVEINHGNNLISVYSNLAADGLIELGEIVKKGTVIGKVGQSAMFEFENPEHLHFEMQLDEKPVDPSDYLTIFT